MPTVTETGRLISILIGLSLVLSTLEMMIPKPVPFFRLGLSNLPLVLSLRLLKTRDIFILALAKVFLQAMLYGTLFSYIFVFSFSGTLLSVCLMVLALRLFKNNISFIGISLLGALAFNSAQLFAAYFILLGKSVFLVAPFFYLAGIVSSVILGYVVERFYRESQWLRLLEAQGFGQEVP